MFKRLAKSHNDDTNNISPLAKRLRKRKEIEVQNSKLDIWLEKKGIISSSLVKPLPTNKVKAGQKNKNFELDENHKVSVSTLSNIEKKTVIKECNNYISENGSEKRKNNQITIAQLSNTTKENCKNWKIPKIEINNKPCTSKSFQKCKGFETKKGKCHKKEIISRLSPDLNSICNVQTSPLTLGKNSKRKVLKPIEIKNLKKNKNISSSPNKQSTLTCFLKKNTNQKISFERNNLFDSSELPTFNNIKKRNISSKSKEQKALFQKYGVVLPTMDEMLRDKKDLENLKQKLESFIPMSEDSLELSFSKNKMQSPIKQKELDCKHLDFKQLSNHFKNNVPFLSNIINEKVKNHRHQRFFNENSRALTFSTNDLTYNTSTIVFSYEQIDYLMSLLKRKFDPDDTKTQYFFKVLLPELCLKIFIDTHKMTCKKAIKYLDERPI